MKHEGLQYSSYIDYTCQVLEEAVEQDSDLVLVSLVRMQCIVDAAYKNLSTKSTADDIRAPAWMHIKAARSQLEKYWALLKPDIQQNGTSTSSWTEKAAQFSLFHAKLDIWNNKRRFFCSSRD
jgi:hypothetical protein